LRNSLIPSRAIVVEITDRGPYVKGRDLDVSEGAARLLGLIHEGVASLEVLNGHALYGLAKGQVLLLNEPSKPRSHIAHFDFDSNPIAPIIETPVDVLFNINSSELL
jgi:hypothetical protein